MAIYEVAGIAFNGVTFNPTEVGDFYGLQFNPTGTRFYFCIDNMSYQFDMNPAWDISSALYEAQFGMTFNVRRGMNLAIDDGRFILSGCTNGQTYRYQLNGAWDLGTGGSGSFASHTDFTGEGCRLNIDTRSVS